MATPDISAVAKTILKPSFEPFRKERCPVYKQQRQKKSFRKISAFNTEAITFSATAFPTRRSNSSSTANPVADCPSPLETASDKCSNLAEDNTNTKQEKNDSEIAYNLYYELYGEEERPKQRLLLIMGLYGTIEFWKLQIDYFVALGGWQICVLDNVGSGRSDIPKGPYSTLGMAEGILELLSYIGWQDGIHAIGLSLGAMILQRMVIMAPNVFATVTFVNTFFSSMRTLPSFAEMKFFVKSLTCSEEEAMLPLIRLTFGKIWRKGSLPGTSIPRQQLLRELRKSAGKSAKEFEIGRRAQLEAIVWHNASPNCLKSLREYGVRPLVVHGERDLVIRPWCGKQLAELLDCPYVEFKDVGHMVPIEAPVEFNRLLLNHIEGQDPATVAMSLERPSTAKTFGAPTTIKRFSTFNGAKIWLTAFAAKRFYRSTRKYSMIVEQSDSPMPASTP